MPLKRKLIKVGNSRAVIIPPDWLRYFEDKTGQPVTNVLMELNGIIRISVDETKPQDNVNEK
jgi:antitoxin component of MazEF toxin-antitoxin module